MPFSSFLRSAFCCSPVFFFTFLGFVHLPAAWPLIWAAWSVLHLVIRGDRWWPSAWCLVLHAWSGQVAWHASYDLVDRRRSTILDLEGVRKKRGPAATHDRRLGNGRRRRQVIVRYYRRISEIRDRRFYCSTYLVRGDATRRLRVEKADDWEDENLICSVNQSNVAFHPLSYHAKYCGISCAERMNEDTVVMLPQL